MSTSVTEVVATQTATLPQTPSGPPVMTSALNSSTVVLSTSSTPVGAIVGGVVGGIAVIGLIALGFFYIIRRPKEFASNNNRSADTKDVSSISDGSVAENQLQEVFASERSSDPKLPHNLPGRQGLGSDGYGFETLPLQQRAQNPGRGLQLHPPSSSFFGQPQEPPSKGYGGHQDVTEGAVGVEMESSPRQGHVPVYESMYYPSQRRTGALPPIPEE
ncbi:hypothetical protein QBC47DRAFT_362160 [Echria macrotheca]|uniref:Uncharacterized protein n=1 Tax=Echria macrotheca TaxID=438768 RepID=A0AAJ0BE34_9PEZI|nr:hypothetical protein QBC47DRAFT_362160 [Echria macrotheca]